MALICVKTLYQGFAFQLRCLFNFQYLIHLNHKLPNNKTVNLGSSSGRNGRRYQIVCIDPDNKEYTIGCTNTTDGASISSE